MTALFVASAFVVSTYGGDTSADPCAVYEYPCENTADCCEYWEAHQPGTVCQAECTQDAAGQCNYCQLTGSSTTSTTSTTTTSVPTGSTSASGCDVEYPCETTDDCCSYWDAHFPGTQCQAECTQDAAGGCNHCYLTGSIPTSSTSTTTSTTSPTGSNSECTQHEYPCETTADCCLYWHAHHPGTVCEAKCTQSALSECNYCYLPSSGTVMNPRPKSQKRRRRKGKKAAAGSSSGCPQHDYPCDTTADCCAYWDVHFPGTQCEAECTQDTECNYCYLTSSSNTGSDSGCPPHDYPCDTTDDCCSYWDQHFPGTDCQAECTVDAAGGCNYCYLTSSSTPMPVDDGEDFFDALSEAGSNGDGTSDKPCASHEYPCDSTADCCSYWDEHFPGTECKAECTKNEECNYCFLTSSSTSTPTTSTTTTTTTSGSGCPPHDYSCDTTTDCCAYWDQYYPGTQCEAECTVDAAGGCNYCYLTGSGSTGSASGCPPHDFPCDSTVDCCSYWDVHFPGTQCEAECTVDAADGCNYCYLTSSSVAMSLPIDDREQAFRNAMNIEHIDRDDAGSSYSWLSHFKMNALISLSVVIVTAAAISAFFIFCGNGVCRGRVEKEKLISQPHSNYGSV